MAGCAIAIFYPTSFDLYRVEAVIQAAGAEYVLYCAIAPFKPQLIVVLWALDKK